MKILLDECVPSPLRKLLAGHECHTAQEMILELPTNKLRAIEAAAAQFRDAIATMSGIEFRRLEISL